MSTAGSDYGPALAEAQAQGFAETDPSLDMGAFDPRSKAVILAAHAYGAFLSPNEVLNLGIEGISAADIAHAARAGKKIKVVAGLYRLSTGQITALVTPQFVGPESPLYAIEHEFNGVFIEAGFAGPQFLSGRGAGGHPTGSAVLADVLALRRGFRYGYAKQENSPSAPPADELEGEFYLRHANANQLCAALILLNASATGLVTDQDGAFAHTHVPLAQLLVHRHALRATGVFIALLGQLRLITQQGSIR